MHRKKALIITLLFGLNSILSVLSQVFIARFFGTSIALDNFLIAVTIPTLLITIFYGTVNDAFLPEFMEISQKNKNQSQKYAGMWFKQIILFSFLAFTLSLIIPKLILTTLFNTVNIQIISYFRYLSYALLFALPNSLLMSLAYAKNHYYLPVLLQLLGALVNFLFIALLSSVWGIMSLVVGFVANMAVQFFFLLPYLRFLNIRKSKFFDRQIYIIWLPLVGMAFLFRIDSLILRTASLGLGIGMVSVVNYASRFFSMSSGIITSGIKALFLPILSNRLTTGNTKGAKQVIQKSLFFGLMLSIISALLIYLIRVPLVQILLMRGSFTDVDANAVISLIPYFIPAAIGWGMFQITAIPYFAVKQNSIPLIVSAIGAVLGYGFSLYFKNTFLILTAPIAIAIMLLFDSFVLFILWYKKETRFLNRKIGIANKE